MNLQDLFYNLKFAYHLKKKGLLEALVHEIRDFEDKYYYPFLLEKKVVMLESIFKSLARTGIYEDIDELKEKAKEITEELFTEIYGEKKFTQDVLDDLEKEGKIFQIVKKVLEEINKGKNEKI